jgi:hypothetical protein
MQLPTATVKKNALYIYGQSIIKENQARKDKRY